MKKRELFEKIYNESFSGLEKYNPIMIHLLGLPQIPTAIHSLLKMLYSAVGIKYEKKKSMVNASDVFVFSSSYMTRDDYRKCFNSLIGILDNTITIEAKKKLNISLQAICRLFRSFLWIKQLRGCTFRQKMFIISQLYEGYNSLKSIQRLLKNEDVRLCTTFCDTHLVDSLVTEYFNSKNITTITLQHGHYVNVPEVDEYSTKIHFTMCISSYMLTFGEYTNNQAIECGMDEKKLKALGMLKYIGQNAESSFSVSKTGTFGVVMSFEKEEKANVEMLKISNVFARKSGMKYIIRFHPSNNYEDYLKYIDTEVGSISRYSMEEFTKNSEFVTVGKSTMFIEMMYTLKPAFIYAAAPEGDSFPGIEWCKFSNTEELLSIYKNIFQNENELKNIIFETREKLCRTNDIAQNYRDFYNSIDERKF